MNHYQDQTKKKPLIQYHKMKYNQPTISIKDKIKKDKSVQKQNTYEQHHGKKFKDYNSKYSTQYQNLEMGNQIYKKGNPNTGLPLTPSNIQQTNSNTSNIQQQTILNKNLTFGLVKNNKQLLTKQAIHHHQNYNKPPSNDSQHSLQSNNNSHYISVNVNIQNLTSNNNHIIQGTSSEYNNNKKPTTKYEVKPLTMNSNLNNLLLKKNQPILKINSNQEEKRKVNNNSNTTNLMNGMTSITQNTQRFMERTTILDRNNLERNIQRNDRIERKQKFKKQLQEKYNNNLTSSPIDKDFLCEEELDIKPMEKKPLIYMDKKLSEKKLPIPHLNQHSLISTQNQIAMNSQRYNTKKIDKKAMEQKQLKQFESQEQEINSLQCSQAMDILFQQQEKYMVNPTYLEKTQKAITWTVRAILMDWMRQLSHQYALKRDTYHLAVVLVDNYLARKSNVQKHVAQVIGATTLFIASKLQELECRPSQSFAQSTQGICTDKDIQNLEIQICKTLQFKLNPPTICSLANRIMTQWDKYIDQVDYAMHHLCFEGKQKVYFKKLDQSSYRLFRQLMQYIDCVILDIQTSQYKPLLIVLSLMYLIIGIKVGGFTQMEIHQAFPRGSHYLLDRSNYFNDLFQNFVVSTFGLTLLQILPSVQYTASYFNLYLTYEKPLLGENQDELEQMDLEQYCSYQTYNRHMLKTVTSRFRGIMNAF